MAGEQHHYHAYLLRLWQAGNGDVPEWRFLLEDAHTHERHGFMTLAGLVSFLERQIDRTQPSSTSRDDERTASD